MPSTMAAIETVLDADELHRVIGRPARLMRLRVKPEVSLTFSLGEVTRDRPCGWGRLLWPDHRVKAVKATARAQRHGRVTEQRELANGLLLQLGDIDTDPRLIEHVAAARSQGLLEQPVVPEAGEAPSQEADGPHGAQILRYNPMRRLVAAVGDQVVRVTARPQDREISLTGTLPDLTPVPERTWPRPEHQEDEAAPGTTGEAGGDTADGTNETGEALEETGARPVHVTALRRVGDTDLSTSHDIEATRSAGAALARMHTRGTATLAPTPSVPELVEAHAGVLDALAPDLASRARRLALTVPGLPEGRGVLSHGDFSPDQVLHDTSSGRIWLIDFERVCLAPPAVDLGSYLHLVDDRLAEALLEGYERAGGEVPDEQALRAGRLRAAVARLTEPLRRGEPGWRIQIEIALAQLEDAWARP